MIYTSENNWYSWQYDGIPFSLQTGNCKFSTQFSPISKLSFGHFKDELLNAARSTLEYYPNIKPSILLSGGLDSEIMLRSYLGIGACPKIFIFRYEKDYNIYDVSYAIALCSSLELEYELIDFNLEKFYENDAEYYYSRSQIDRPRALPYCKFLDMVDELPILGASDVTAVRTNDDYSKKGTWNIRCWEHDIGWSKFIKEIDKPAIAEWFKWTPGLVYSFTKLQWFQNLISDEYYGKLGTNSTKIIGYKEVYPNLLFRFKKTGFEKIDHLVNDFETFLENKYGLKYRNYCDRTIDEFYNEFER